ncbi:hypothetical protein EFL26_00480 [Nocardioides pocheonensis]|uniref:DUF11 domain-containing protein n=1 Tax=Nocardioides pocheonensis TaxID=661485 RepID=A0A3N0GXV9_9ACTN|nr:hypothetical protein EFL26_00480 [Nocardioides pocheonensis]
MAFAYWTTSGSGSGTGSTTAGVSNQLSFSTATLNSMYPGDSSQPLTVTVTNDSGESAYVSTVKAYITTNKSGCTGADFLLNGSAAPSIADDAVALTWTGQDLAAGTDDDATGTIQFNNTGSPQNACKSADVTIHYVAS